MSYRHNRLFADERVVDLWRRSLAQSRREQPFNVDAGVVLPDHVHLIIVLPAGEADVSRRIGRAKALLTKALGAGKSSSSTSRRRHRESDVWQRRFFDHMIRDEQDYARRIDYVHYNPVKHGCVECPKDWRHSSFHHWVAKGAYALDWGCPDRGTVPDLSSVEDSAGE